MTRRTKQQGGDVGDDADERPGRLQPGEVRVDAGDEHVADAVEQRGDRQQDAVGAGCEAAGGEVGGEQQAEDDGEERHQVGRQRGGAPEGDERVGADRDERGHEHEPELGRATGGGDHGAALGRVVGGWS